MKSLKISDTEWYRRIHLGRYLVIGINYPEGKTWVRDSEDNKKYCVTFNGKEIILTEDKDANEQFIL